MGQSLRMWWIVCSASLQSQSAETMTPQVCSQATVSCSQPEYSGLFMSCQTVDWVSIQKQVNRSLSFVLPWWSNPWREEEHTGTSKQILLQYIAMVAKPKEGLQILTLRIALVAKPLEGGRTYRNKQTDPSPAHYLCGQTLGGVKNIRKQSNRSFPCVLLWWPNPRRGEEHTETS